MENQEKTTLSKMELMVVIIAAVVLAIGLAAMIAGGWWYIHPLKSTDTWLYLTLLIVGVLWFVTSPLLMVGIIFKYSKKVMIILSVVSLCCINATGLATLLLMMKKKNKVNITKPAFVEGVQKPEGTPAEEPKPEEVKKEDQPKVEEPQVIVEPTIKPGEIKPEEPKIGE